MRIKRGVTSRKRHQKIAKAAKGYRGRNRTTYKTAKQAVMKAGLHSYRDRQLKKRNYRSLWIVRLNTALKAQGSSYAVFIHAMTKQGIIMNRKALSEMAIHDPKGFEVFVKQVVANQDAPAKQRVAKAKPASDKSDQPVTKPSVKKESVVKAPAKKPVAKSSEAKSSVAKSKE